MQKTPKTIEKKSEAKPEMAPKKSTIGGQEDTRTPLQRKMANDKIINNGKDAYDNYPSAREFGVKRDEFNKRMAEQNRNIDNGKREY